MRGSIDISMESSKKLMADSQKHSVSNSSVENE